MSAGDEKITTTHIPAFPGWSVGTPQVDDQFLTDAVWWEPVIAWVVRTSEMEGEPTHSWADPVSIGQVSTCKRYVIRSPDGIIDEPEAGRHVNDDCVVSHWREQDIRTKARRAAKAAK